MNGRSPLTVGEPARLDARRLPGGTAGGRGLRPHARVDLRVQARHERVDVRLADGRIHGGILGVRLVARSALLEAPLEQGEPLREHAVLVRELRDHRRVVEQQTRMKNAARMKRADGG